MAMLTLAGGQWSASADENTPTLMFGAYVAARNGLSIQASVQAMEARLGRPLAAVRVFDVWDQPFPSSYDLWLRDTGHTLFFSVDAVRTNKVRIPWRSLADSQPGSALYNEIVGWANRIKAFGAHIYFTFNHEPEEKAGTVAGTAADFIDAWRKIVTVFRAQGVTNAEYTWIMTDYAFWRTDGGRASLWYPGDAYVDNIASDAYNWYNCRPGINNQWRSLSWIAGWMRDFGAAHPDKGLFLTEFASHEDTSTPGRKASWINDVQQLFKQPGWEQFQGILYYHQSHKPTCLFWLDSSTTSMAAITALANDPFFGRYEVGSDAPPTAPGKPAASSDAPGQVTLNWQAATDDHATTLLYRIYRDHGTTPVGTTSSSSTGIVSFTDTNVPAGTHTYAVSASDGSNEGPQSADSDGVSVADPTDAPPTAPGKPAASSDAPGQVTLNWQAATDDHATTLLYRLYRDQGTTPVGTTSSSSTGIVSFTDTNVPAGTHTYAVSASDGSNEGPRSADSDDVSVAGSTSVFADDFSAGFTNWSGSTAMSLDPSQGGDRLAERSGANHLRARMGLPDPHDGAHDRLHQHERQRRLDRQPVRRPPSATHRCQRQHRSGVRERHRVAVDQVRRVRPTDQLLDRHRYRLAQRRTLWGLGYVAPLSRWDADRGNLDRQHGLGADRSHRDRRHPCSNVHDQLRRCGGRSSARLNRRVIVRLRALATVRSDFIAVPDG